MMRTMARVAILAASAGGALLSGPAAAQLAVFDPSVFARQFEQLTEMKKQVETLTSQLKVAQNQLGQAKQLYDSFNKLTNVNDIASLLNSSEFRKYLPSEFSKIEGLIKGTGSDGFSSAIDSYLRNNRYYTQNVGNSFYASELERIARQTGTKQSIGQAVYDTASKRVDELEKLRQQISASKDVKDVLDLSARFQAEQALLQNDVLRMQGLAMVQRAQSDMDLQRERERARQLIDEMKSALQ
jgi:type IV secretion system protein VirB5